MRTDEDHYQGIRIKLMSNLHTAASVAKERGLALIQRYPKAILVEQDFTFKPRPQKKKADAPHGVKMLMQRMKEKEVKLKQATTDSIGAKKGIGMSITSSIDLSR